MSEPLPAALKGVMSATETADYLCSQLGEKPAYWLTWLANDRKPNRVNRRLPVVPGPGRPRYDAAMVESFVAECKRAYASVFPKGMHPGTKAGRLAPHISAMTLAEGADHAAVLFVITKPLASFVLSAKEARQIASRLINAAEEIESESDEK
jgi:hypothetical protein